MTVQKRGDAVLHRKRWKHNETVKNICDFVRKRGDVLLSNLFRVESFAS